MHAWLKMVKQNFKACKRWKKCSCLVIDEISMMSVEMFENLDIIARAVRNKTQPFGGIALVFTGDFQQLRPVGASRLCFQSALWDTCFPKGHCIELTKIYRQQDKKFIDMLDNVRDGYISRDQVQLITALQRPLCSHDGILPTMLKSLNLNVFKHNQNNLKLLGNRIMSFVAVDSGTEIHLTNLKKSCKVSDIIQLAVGAQVILTRNLDVAVKLANGSRGVITSFQSGFPMVRFMHCAESVHIKLASWTTTKRTQSVRDGKVYYVIEELACRKQVPLQLGWALSIHRSQSLSIDKLSVDLGAVFESSQIYVALSRARSLQGLQVTNFRPSELKPNSTCSEFNNRLLHLQQDVRFNGVFHRSGIWASPTVFKFLAFANEDAEEDSTTEDSGVEEIVMVSKRQKNH